jgi:hypothetical protein
MQATAGTYLEAALAGAAAAGVWAKEAVARLYTTAAAIRDWGELMEGPEMSLVVAPNLANRFGRCQAFGDNGLGVSARNIMTAKCPRLFRTDRPSTGVSGPFP